MLQHDFLSKMSGTISEQVNRFTENIKMKLRENKVIRTEMKEKRISCKRICKLVILRAQTTEPGVKKEITRYIKKECYELRKRTFKAFMKEEIKKLKNMKYREAWKFIKTRSRLNRNTVECTSLNCNEIGEEQFNDCMKARIAKRHFEKLFSSCSDRKTEIKIDNVTRHEDTELKSRGVRSGMS
ncbi:hypothetical protein NUSPORA_02799 [Nucleospora cyclopteri]